MKTTIKQLIEKHEKLQEEYRKELARVEYLWNVKDYSLEYRGKTQEMYKEIQEFLSTEVEMN